MSTRLLAAYPLILTMSACLSACGGTDGDAVPASGLPQVNDPSTAGDGGALPVDADADAPDPNNPGPNKPDPLDPSAQDAGSPMIPDPATPGSIPHGACLDGITDYQAEGPFEFKTETAGDVKLWVPQVPAGCKVPVVHLANGTGATCGNYQGALERLASHGFLTTCYEDRNTGAGTQGVMAFEAALSMYPELADNKLGSTGHSQGGQAAFVAMKLAEEKWGDTMIYAGLAMQPASGYGEQPTSGTWQEVYGKIKSPMFMFSGTADLLVSESWVERAFDAMPEANEVYWWSAVGARHIPTPVTRSNRFRFPGFAGSCSATRKPARSSRTCPTVPTGIPASRRTSSPASQGEVAFVDSVGPIAIASRDWRAGHAPWRAQHTFREPGNRQTHVEASLQSAVCHTVLEK